MSSKSFIGQLASKMPYIVGGLLFFASMYFWMYKYPAHLAFQEQSQLFLWNSDYFSQTVCNSAGMAHYIGAFLTQFYYEIWWGATIISLITTGIYALTYVALRKATSVKEFIASFLSLLPALFAWSSQLGKHSLLALPVALLFTLGAIIGYQYLHKVLRSKYLYYTTIILTIILLHYLFGVISFLYAISIVTTEIVQNKNYASISFIAVSAILPFLWYIATPTTLERVYTSNCYHRLLDGEPQMTYNAHEEDALHYSFLARYNKWGTIISRAEKRMPLDMASRQVLLCALAQKGQLLDRMFEFPVINSKDLISEQLENMTEPMTVSDIFFSIGFLNQAEQAAHNAQQIYQSYSVRSFQRWAECCIIKGDNNLAKKYLDALDQTLFYKNWAKSRRDLVGNKTAIGDHKVYGPISRRLMKDTYYFSNDELDNILAHSTGPTIDFNINYDYLIAYLILKNDLDKLAAMHEGYTGRLNKATQEALVLYWMQHHQSFKDMPWRIDRDVVTNVIEFYKNLNSGGTMKTMHPRFGKTYWYYNVFASKLFQ